MMVARIVAAARIGSVPGDIDHHAGGNQLLAGKTPDEFQAPGIVELVRQGEEEFPGKAGIAPPLHGLEGRPEKSPLAEPCRHGLGAEDFGRNDAVRQRSVVVDAPGSRIGEAASGAVGGSSERPLALAPLDVLHLEPVECHARLFSFLVFGRCRARGVAPMSQASACDV